MCNRNTIVHADLVSPALSLRASAIATPWSNGYYRFLCKFRGQTTLVSLYNRAAPTDSICAGRASMNRSVFCPVLLSFECGLTPFPPVQITASETPLAKAGDLCPVTLLLHCATVKKPSSSDGHAVTGTLSQIMGREPFFRGKPPRSYLLLPIFVQSRFAGVLYLSARVSVNLQATQSQVGLLST